MTRIARTLLVSAVCVLVAACLQLALVPVHADTEAEANTSELSLEYQKRLAAVDAADAEARYGLGLWLFEQHAPKSMDPEALELARIELLAAIRLGEKEHAEKLLGLVDGELSSIVRRAHPDFWSMAFSVIGGLGIFLLGMKNLSEGIQTIAGDRLRRMISAVTDNRFLAVGTGAGVTCLVQSSSITTVIVVGFVNSGLMLLHQAVGVIMGANIGTTITGWILVLKVGKYGLPLIGIAGFTYLFARKERLRYLAMAALGLGMVFFGLELMKDGFKPMKDVPAFEEAFRWFQADSYFGVLKCAAVGCVLTLIVQSSSATLGITIGLAQTGVIPFETAAALVLGENIGTTITAWLASIGTVTVAKRAAYAHVFFNVIGVVWITAIFTWYVQIVGSVVEFTEGTNPVGLSLAASPHYATLVTSGIALTHSGFNITNTLVFLPFVRKFAAFLEWLIPDRKAEETSHLTSLDVRMVESPVIGIEQSRGEIIKMARGAQKMLDWTSEIMNSNSPQTELVREVFLREEVIDQVEHEVVAFLTALLTGNVPFSISEEGREQFRVADEYESVSDYVVVVLKSYLRMERDGKHLTEPDAAAIREIHGEVTEYLKLITRAFEQRQSGVFKHAATRGDEITHLFKRLRREHLDRVGEGPIDAGYSQSFNTMLGGYRKIKDHAFNIAEEMRGQK